MSLAQLRKMSRRQESDQSMLDRVARDKEPVATMPKQKKKPPRVRFHVKPCGVATSLIPGFLYWWPEPQPGWPPVVGSPEAEAAKAAAEDEWRRLYGDAA